MAERKADIPFLFIGNHRCLDFINTQLVVSERPVDLLASFSDLVDWLVRAGRIAADEEKNIKREGARQGKGAETLALARAFRAMLREMVERIAARKPVPEAALQAINELLRQRVGYPQLTRRARGFERTYLAESENSNQLLGVLAEVASDLLCTCDLSLIKKCQNPSCVLFFYDTTKNHARHWCSMSMCGNRSKVAAHYQRHRNRKS
jgi:predicted RNA-binding Zn ribbon-like protein